MTITRELAEEAAEALRWFVRPKRTQAAWACADEPMAALRRAVDAGDEDGVRVGLSELDRLSRRVQEKLGQESDDTEAPPRIRDRANELVHTLAPEQDER